MNHQASSVTPGSLNAWWLAIRPKTLSAGAVPVAIGTAVAHQTGGVRYPGALAALVVGLALQMAANFANDVFDYQKGADTHERLGPVRTAQSGLLTPRQLHLGLGFMLALAFSAGSYLALTVTPWLWIVGILAMVSAVAYTAGPYPLGYNGLGDVFVILFFGFVAVCGTAYVQVGRLEALSWLSAVPAGALATAILTVNNIRDRHTDAIAGKRTLVVRFGGSFGRGEYILLLASSFAVPTWLAVSGRLGLSVLLPWLVAPLAVRLARSVATDEGSALNGSLEGTARLMAIFGALYSVGVALG